MGSRSPGDSDVTSSRPMMQRHSQFLLYSFMCSPCVLCIVWLADPPPVDSYNMSKQPTLTAWTVIAVKLAGLDGEQFRGLFVQARNGNGEPVGQFQPSTDSHVTLTNCGEGTNVSTKCGNYIYHLIWHEIFCILPTECMCVFRMVLTINSDCSPKQH
jgi:hypothetical protein